MRPPGGYTTDMFNYACDIDIYRIWAELVVRRQAQVNYRRMYHCCYASRKSNLSYARSHSEIMSRYGGLMVQVAQVPGVFSSALGDIGYIFRTESLDHLLEIVRFIHQTEN
jgi:hypothetical protein